MSRRMKLPRSSPPRKSSANCWCWRHGIVMMKRVTLHFLLLFFRKNKYLLVVAWCPWRNDPWRWSDRSWSLCLTRRHRRRECWKLCCWLRARWVRPPTLAAGIRAESRICGAKRECAPPCISVPSIVHLLLSSDDLLPITEAHRWVNTLGLKEEQDTRWSGKTAIPHINEDARTQRYLKPSSRRTCLSSIPWDKPQMQRQAWTVSVRVVTWVLQRIVQFLICLTIWDH